ncbi:MAG: Fe-S cluster assembly protein SufD [Chloroflexi bacterium]|nr:Fe-S cluster assembly protein SufD [Chloroflexota bacterium]
MTMEQIQELTFSADTIKRLSEILEEPGWMLDLRLTAWRFFQEIPWPTGKEETWRRTPLRGFHLEAYTPFDVDAFTHVAREEDLGTVYREHLAELASSGELVMDEGQALYHRVEERWAQQGVIFTDMHTAVREHPELVQRYFARLVELGDNKFAALHYAFWRGGTFLYVPRNVEVTLPFQTLARLSKEKSAGFYHTIVVTEENASVTLLEDFFGGREGMHDGVVELFPGPNSRLRYAHVQDWDLSLWNFGTQRVRASRDAEVVHLISSWGSKLSKVWITLDLVEPGARGQLLGVYFTTDSQHVDHHTMQNHIAPACSSDLLYKGALKDESRSVYQGYIKVWPGAQKTDAYQANRNLLLDGRARADSIPGLEIEADDVRCTHGATAGQIPEEYIFYMESRGLDRTQAERLIVAGFFQEVLERVENEDVQRKLEATIADRLGVPLADLGFDPS